MRFFAHFRPRLVGSVLSGTADTHTPVQLHLFSDDVEAFARFLAEHDIPARQQSRRVRLDRHTEADYPVFLLTADGLPFDLTIMPLDRLRQAPLDPVDEHPTPRASLAAVEALLVPDRPPSMVPAAPGRPIANPRQHHGARRSAKRRRG